jgi:hypothetical protein
LLLGWVNELRNFNEVYSDSMPLTSIASGMTWEIDEKSREGAKGLMGRGTVICMEKISRFLLNAIRRHVFPMEFPPCLDF